MTRRRAFSLVIAVAAVAANCMAPARALAARRACLVPGVGKPLGRVWRPDVIQAIGYARTRAGDIAFALRTDQRFYGYRPEHQEWSASVVKVMLMAAYLDRRSVARRPLDADETSLLGPMITQSDNDSAQKVFDTVGQRGLHALAVRAGMTRFATNPIWGETEITAADQTRFLLHIERYIARRHVRYAMRLLASVVPRQRWGIGSVAPKGWKLYFKGGWGYGTGLIDSQVALLVRGCMRVSVAVLTMYDGSHGSGKETLRGIFETLLIGLPTGKRSRYGERPRRPQLRKISRQRASVSCSIVEAGRLQECAATDGATVGDGQARVQGRRDRLRDRVDR